MMHTSKFDSFSVFHHGDYSGEMEFIKRLNGEPVYLDSDKEEPMSLYLELSELIPLARAYASSYEAERIRLTGRVEKDCPSGATRSFSVSGKDLFSFYIGSIQHGLIGKLEQMESSEFYQRFMKSVDVSVDDICKDKAILHE